MTHKSYHRTYNIHEIGFIELSLNHDNYVLDYVTCMSSTIWCQLFVITPQFDIISFFFLN